MPIRDEIAALLGGGPIAQELTSQGGSPRRSLATIVGTIEDAMAWLDRQRVRASAQRPEPTT
jgi:hypothetical protein